MDVYAENILEHYRDPRNTGKGDGATVSASENNPSCGDTLTVHLWIDGEQLQTIAWEGEGCAISQAGMSILSEELPGKSIDQVLHMKKDDIYDLLGVPVGPRRFKCALLCLHTVKNTLRKHKGLEPQSWIETTEVE